MAEDEGKARGGVEPFSPRIFPSTPRPGQGPLPEAWHTETGAPVCLLSPFLAEVKWRPEDIARSGDLPLPLSRREIALTNLCVLLLGLSIGLSLLSGVGGRLASPPLAAGNASSRAPTEHEDAELPELLRSRSPGERTTADAGVPVPLTRKMPTTRMKGQKRPPCDAFENELNDACWYELKSWKPGCGEAYEGVDKRCYMPVVERKPPPNAAEP